MMHRELSTLSQLMVSLLLLLFMNNCKSSSSAYPLRSARSAMNLEADLPQMETVVFHLNDSVTRVFLKLPMKICCINEWTPLLPFSHA